MHMYKGRTLLFVEEREWERRRRWKKQGNGGDFWKNKWMFKTPSARALLFEYKTLCWLKYGIVSMCSHNVTSTSTSPITYLRLSSFSSFFALSIAHVPWFLFCIFFSVKWPRQDEWMIDPVIIADIYEPEVWKLSIYAGLLCGVFHSWTVHQNCSGYCVAYHQLLSIAV